jgi:hypothetical protein
METYTITDAQWQQINSAINVAISVCLMHKREFMGQMVDAGVVMDEIVNGPSEDEE